MLPPLYLDDCADRDELRDRLRRAGFEVYTPRSERILGRDDPDYLAYAARNGFAILTFNTSDFEDLHQEWTKDGREHAGILLVYFDNDRRRDMQPADIVRALLRLTGSGLPLANATHSLNMWKESSLMRTAWLEINLDAYRRNLQALSLHTGRPVLAVLKANAYGHGLTHMAPAALDAGCPGVAVALPEEGAELRTSGFEGRIVVFGVTLPEQSPLLVEHELEPTVVRAESAIALSTAAAAAGKTIGAHVKVDTGMTRVGIEPEQALAFCSEVAALPGVRLAGVYTHFAGAESDDATSVDEQWALFRPLVEALSMWSPRPTIHAANSPAGLWFAASWLDWIRGGIITYGVPPGGRALPFEVEPVATLKARLVQVREVPAGRKVSYSGTWTAPRPSRLALAPLGYADGVPWALGNRGCALVRGQRVPIVGRICMDQLVLDVTAVPLVEEGEEAVFLGRQGHQQITAMEWADLAGTISYEILTRLSQRLPRIII